MTNDDGSHPAEAVKAGALTHRSERVGSGPRTIVDLLAVVDGADIEFDPDRLDLTARTADL